MKKITSMLLTAVIAATLTLPSCVMLTKRNDPPNLMADIKPSQGKSGLNDTSNVNSTLSDTEFNTLMTDFGVKLFKASLAEDKNTLISPLSVITALAMTANGADNNTYAEFEALFGADIPSLNRHISDYAEKLPESKYYKLKLANSIWFTDDKRFTVNEDFLRLNADYYGADIFAAPFNDETRDNINSWVEEKTDRMIKNILDKIPEDAVMYLVNALAFDAEWQNIYKSHEMGSNIFTTENGDCRETEFMYSDESTYLCDADSEGMIKYYKDKKYAFAALLPKEGVTITEYVSGLTGEKIASILGNAKTQSVKVWLPKFESEFSCEMSEILKSLGLKDAFDGYCADFSKLGSSIHGNIFISRVLHKTFISVDDRGTKAGAATVVELSDECAHEILDQKEVRLNRPFVYMLIDCERNIPFFIGTVLDVK